MIGVIEHFCITFVFGEYSGMEWFSYTSCGADLLDMRIYVSVRSFLSTGTLEIRQGYTIVHNHLKYFFTFVQQKVRPGLQICSLTIVEVKGQARSWNVHK